MIYDKLRQDHQEALRFFDEIADSGADDVRRREGLFVKLKDCLLKHARAEEKVFYPILRRNEPTRKLVENCLEDHQEAEAMLGRLERMERNSAEWIEELLELRESMAQHMSEEESDLFDVARELLSDAEANELGAKFEEEKTKAA